MNDTVIPPTRPEAASKADDLAAFRLDQSYATATRSRPLLTTIPVRKPGKTAWIFIHPGDQWRFSALVYEREVDRTMYLLSADAAQSIDGELVRAVNLIAYSDSDGNLALLPVPMPREDGSTCDWHESMRDFAANYAGQWLQIRSRRSLGAYVAIPSPVDRPAPSDPPMAINEIVKIAFKDRRISDRNHIVLRQLRGEVA